MIHTAWAIAVMISLINVPFGWWRAAVRKLSAAWFAAVHIPVALAIGLRIAVGVPLRLVTLPLFVVAYILGQTAGARLRSRRATAAVPP